MAFSVHLKHKGIPLSLPLDIIEVAKVKLTLLEPQQLMLC